ncbi:hypothetical protein A3K72_02600 [Candidatus Woesearchaeota archaeon RBG_13_36_6]|nr:MAG: hypothetical protein A3K72_02600 [Candidatus Woesearchaeota archaeon RBG_13_36_6]
MSENTEKEVNKRKEVPYKLELEYNREHYIKYSKQAARILYWLVLLMLTICNFLIFIILVPLILIIKSSIMYLIVGTLGFIFGLVFNFLINDIEHLEPKHHRFAAGFIPVIGMINIFLIISIERFLQGPGYYQAMDVVVASFVYFIMFVLPYFAGVFKKK